MSIAWDLYAHFIADVQIAFLIGLVAHMALPQWGRK